ncbi:sensor histidine kinase [Salininema proteolyticum]|uniref:histidine kinase n=1 Tax=Salininema proteolyticum TaxID=1607685 RepID=A0ABV8U1U0_9ACTN
MSTKIAERLVLLWSTTALLLAALTGVGLIAFAAASGMLVLFWIGIPATLLSFAAIRAWANWHRRALLRYCGHEIGVPYREPEARSWDRRLLAWVKQAATWRDVAWLAINSTLGVLVYTLLLAVLVGGIYLTVHPFLNWWVYDHQSALAPVATLNSDSPWRAFLFLPVGLLLIATWWHWGLRLVRWYTRMANVLLGPTRAMRLQRRVSELSRSRADTVEAAAAELRRIERDLHDGAQARLVALALNLGLAEEVLATSPQQARKLVVEARHETQSVLSDIRDLVRGIYPPVLADRGLSGALVSTALGHPLPVAVVDTAQVSLPLPLESAMYFAANEVLTNVSKYARAGEVTMTASTTDDGYRLEIVDDGRGGARFTPGGGLEGIRRRLEPFDGAISVYSPEGGPTRVAIEVPCDDMKPRRAPTHREDGPST